MKVPKRAVVWACVIWMFTSGGACIAGSGGERVTLNFRASPIEEVFDALSRKDRTNIILGKGVTGDVSVNLYDVTVPEAIHRIAESAGFAVEYRNGDYVIQDRKEAGGDHPGDFVQLRTFKVQYSDPVQVAEILGKYVSRHGKVTPLNSRRMIVIEDRPEFMTRAGRLLEELHVQPKQVLIEARVLEVTLEDGETFGVDWTRVFSNSGTKHGSFGTSGLTQGNVTDGPKLPGFFFSLVNKNLDVFLEAKANKSRVRTLSSPKLLALENQEAKAVIGNSTGYKVTTTINQVTTESIQFLESGVILKVTPSVDQQGRVLLKVHPEVSSTTLNGGIPDKKSTEVTTEFLCEDGQAVFIGGLLKKESTDGKTGVPVLTDVPFLGRLFSTTTESAKQTETVVIITPRIVENPRMAATLSEKGADQIDTAARLILDRQLKLDPNLLNSQRDISGAN
jgi:type II secretory pathway component GspD/PulD (secretin)